MKGIAFLAAFFPVLAGASMARVRRVYKRGTYPQNPIAVLKTNERGQFAASLEPAIYTVIFRRRGFRTEFIGLEIRPDGGDKELRETLQLASDCAS